MSPEIRRLTRRHCALSAITSILTHPIPGADELFVVPIHYRLSLKMARARNVQLRDVPWRQVHKIIWGGAGVRFGFDLVFGIVPIAGMISHALSAVALTELLGRYLDEALRRPSSPPPPISLRTIKESLMRRVQTESPKASDPG